MRSTITLSTLLTVGSLYAQQINNVVPFPAQPTECQPVRFIFSGVMPSQASIHTFDYTETGNAVIFDLYANGGGGQVAFSHPIEYFGPYAPGTYDLTVNLRHNGNSIDDTWTGTFQIGPATEPNIGEYGSRTICNSEPPFTLASVVIGTLDPGGTWYDPFGAVVPSGMFVPGVSQEGGYMYELNLLPPCEPAFQFVDVFYIPNNSAGIGGPVQACSAASGYPVDLFEALEGTPMTGGTWNGPTPLSGPNGSTYVPGVNTPGQYTYTVAGIEPCADHTVTLTVQGIAPPNAGNGSTVTVCAQDTGNVLSGFVTGEQTTGNWYDPNGFLLGGHHQTLNIANSGSGIYTYVVINGVCPNDSSFVNMTVLLQPCGMGVADVSGSITGLELMPNPVRDVLTVDVQLRDADRSLALEVFSPDGRCVRNSTGIANGTSQRLQVPVHDLAPGLHVLRITSEAGRAVARFVVE